MDENSTLIGQALHDGLTGCSHPTDVHCHHQQQHHIQMDGATRTVMLLPAHTPSLRGKQLAAGDGLSSFWDNIFPVSVCLFAGGGGGGS